MAIGLESNPKNSRDGHELPGLKAQFKSTEGESPDRTDKPNGPPEPVTQVRVLLGVLSISPVHITFLEALRSYTARVTIHPGDLHPGVGILRGKVAHMPAAHAAARTFDLAPARLRREDRRASRRMTGR